jgi:hypothetical protein
MRMAKGEQRANAEAGVGLEDVRDRLHELAAGRGETLPPPPTVLHAVEELRTRGQDHDWLAALIDYLHDAHDRRSDSVREGLDELARGEHEPA